MELFQQIGRRAKWATLNAQDQTEYAALAIVQAEERALSEGREVGGKETVREAS